MHATYDLRAKQQTILTPRLQQSVKLLQMSAIEFTQELRQALSTNPFLEETAEDEEQSATPDGLLDEAPAANLAEPDMADVTATEVAADTTSESDSAYDPPAEYSGDFPTSRANGSGDDDRMDFGEWMHESPGLHEHLHRELAGYRLNDRDRALTHMLVEALDEDGYLRQTFEELEGLVELTPAPTKSEWNTALRLVQQLDSPGLAARDLGECLRLQLQAIEQATPAREVAIRLTEKCLEQLARRNQGEMLRTLGCDEGTLRDACLLIKSLDPKPGLRFAREEAQHIIPDVIVRKIKGRWLVDTNPAVMPRARLNSTYASMFRHARCNDRAPMAQELQEARWLIRNVEQRFTTIQRVAEAIVAHQRTFFEYGEVALKPLVLREVAEELGLHESTVSRATGNKYMATPRGIFEFKHFFSRELSTETGGTCSTTAVRALIKELIAGEDSAAPLSDVTLTQLLAKQGVIVARRTVSKYRTLMKVPPAELRRQF
ncbi:RNA polymerase factor sigma-54 [Verticiella sediminum]|uniref:RNA polymerase sigma-54 factor n=1 Tax=Verticiella sediminum TaxID=1247510 RepID=A0A556AD28_9BURK|nr:RNA polymerase factor sigma-54 [Verticiella sediminum]TSH90789.1 RNA polymerase factor sigma-54 [Verticiella sediminum]